MNDKLVQDLYDECKAELVRHHEIIERSSAFDRENFPKKCKDLYEYRHRVFLVMERLANGKPPPGGKTAWDKINSDDP